MVDEKKGRKKLNRSSFFNQSGAELGRCVGGARRKGWWNQALDQAPANEGLTFDDWLSKIRVVTGAKSSRQSGAPPVGAHPKVTNHK